MASFRSILTDPGSWALEHNPWLQSTPYDIRDYALREALDAFFENVKRLKNKNISHFSLKFRLKRDKTQSIFIRNNCYTNNKMYIRRWTAANCEPLRAHGNNILPKTLERCGRLIYRYPRSYYLAESIEYAIFSKEHTIGGENQTAKHIISLDPGVRTFQTCYDHRGYVFEFGKGDIGRIIRLCYHIDQLISKSIKSNRRMRFLLKSRVIPRMRARIFNLVNDFHRKLAEWLCVNYDYIILPTYETSRMVVKGCRRISRKTVRAMLTWSNYRFSQILKQKTKEYSVILHRCTEEYTSKTCTGCGVIKFNLGGNKVFRCNHCHIIINRDFNGSRNIFVKTCSECLNKALGMPIS